MSGLSEKWDHQDVSGLKSLLFFYCFGYGIADTVKRDKGKSIKGSTLAWSFSYSLVLICQVCLVLFSPSMSRDWMANSSSRGGGWHSLHLFGAVVEPQFSDIPLASVKKAYRGCWDDVNLFGGNEGKIRIQILLLSVTPSSSAGINGSCFAPVLPQCWSTTLNNCLGLQLEYLVFGWSGTGRVDNSQPSF